MPVPAARARPGAVREEDSGDGLSQQRDARLVLPRALWLTCALAAIVWQVAAGRAGVALLVLAAVAPLIVLLPRRAGIGWLTAALAPVLGLIGLAGAYPAIGGQASGGRKRAGLGALGYWWLTLAGPLLGRHLWLGEPRGMPARAVWEGSLSSAAVHVLGPLLSLAVLFGVALWALAALILPWIVRGRNAAFDVVAATIWSATLVSAAAALDSGLSATGAHPSPRGAIAGAVLGGVLAVCARALRGPV